MSRLSLRSVRARIRSTLRYKLLVLVLFPTLLAMPATLGLAVYWFGDFNRSNLFLKVKSDLALAQNAFRQAEQEYLAALQRIGELPSFRAALVSGNSAALQKALSGLIKNNGFAFAHITDELGHWLYETRSGATGSSKPSPLTDRAMGGRPDTGLEVFSSADLSREGPNLPERVRIAAGAGLAGTRQAQNRALVLRAVYPIHDAQGKILALLDAGVVLNRNTEFIDSLLERVYGAGTLPPGGNGTVAVLLDDTRIATNLPFGTKGVAIGTHVASDLRNAVIGDGSVSVRSQRIGDEWYISAYRPLYDVDGQAIGMLQTAFLQAPFQRAQYRAIGLLLLASLALIGLSTWIVLRGAKSIFKPIEQMTAVVRATQAGHERRIGDVHSQDEVGELARQFDAMLDLLQERNREVRRAADELELKVQKRTRQLERKNADLQRTVTLLQETRQRLVTAEKLAALGQMAAGIAHEINNPTAVILGHVDLLVSELGEGAQYVQADIDMIVQQCDRIRYIVDSLLQFARPSPSTDEADIAEVDVNSAVENTLPLVRHALEKVPVRVQKRLVASRQVRIRRYELQEVLINLLLNAARASSAGDTVEVAAADWGQHGVVITVRDEGVGIAPDQIHRVFDPFFTTDASHGSGLGLSVSYGLIRRYGGEITLESELGRGSAFHVWLLEEPVLAVHHDAPRYSWAT